MVDQKTPRHLVLSPPHRPQGHAPRGAHTRAREGARAGVRAHACAHAECRVKNKRCLVRFKYNRCSRLAHISLLFAFIYFLCRNVSETSACSSSCSASWGNQISLCVCVCASLLFFTRYCKMAVVVLCCFSLSISLSLRSFRLCVLLVCVFFLCFDCCCCSCVS